ncbi:MAG TPA: hypothetical protein VGU22_14285 [Methylomirabilota bacterium]|nr:hypothetical protein [Methylomirabilota bacterium]
MAEPPPGDAADERAYRRRFKDKGNKRDDYAVDLFREALGNLADPGRVSRALGELGRLYNPIADGPIVDLKTRQRVVELLTVGLVEEARRLLEGRLGLYLPEGMEGPDPSG